MFCFFLFLQFEICQNEPGAKFIETIDKGWIDADEVPNFKWGGNLNHPRSAKDELANKNEVLNLRNVKYIYSEFGQTDKKAQNPFYLKKETKSQNPSKWKNEVQIVSYDVTIVIPITSSSLRHKKPAFLKRNHDHRLRRLEHGKQWRKFLKILFLTSNDPDPKWAWPQMTLTWNDLDLNWPWPYLTLAPKRKPLRGVQNILK